MGFRRARIAVINGNGSHGPSTAGLAPALLRQLERRRRIFARLLRGDRLPDQWFIRCTMSTLQLDGLAVSEADVAAAVSSAADGRVLRPAQFLRIRNHIAILRRIERAIRDGQRLQAGEVVRWYTMLSGGLSITAMGQTRGDRLSMLLQRINSPQLRVASALEEVAATHAHVIADPLFPGFNGVIARLLLQYHLARCQFPPVLFDPARDAAVAEDETRLLRRLVEMIAGSWGVADR